MYNDLDDYDFGVLTLNGETYPVDISPIETISDTDGDEKMSMDFGREYSFNMMPSEETLREMDKFFHRYGYLFSEIRDKSNNWKKMHGYKMTRRPGRKYRNEQRLYTVDLSDFRIDKVIVDGEEYDYAEVFVNATK